MVENFRPDVKARLGFDYETLKAKNPRIVLVSISAFGQDGPYKDRPGVDQVVQGMSGLMSVTGEPGRGPMRVGIPISDITTGLFAANGVLTALLERHKSGEGQWVQTSLLELQTFMLDLQAARYLVDGVVPQQVGNEHPSGVPTNAYKTKDGYVNVAPIPSMWPRLCKALGREAWIDDPNFATREVRRKRRKEVNGAIADIIAEMDSATLLAKLDAAEVPGGPIYTIEQAYNDPQAKHMQFTQTVAATGGKEMRITAPAVHADPHAEQARDAHPGIRRAHRRSAQGVRVLQRRDQSLSRNRLGRVEYSDAAILDSSCPRSSRAPRLRTRADQRRGRPYKAGHHGSIHLNVGERHDFPPSSDFIGDVLGKIRRRAAGRDAAHVGDARPDRWIGKRGVDLGVQQRHDAARRASSVRTGRSSR